MSYRTKKAGEELKVIFNTFASKYDEACERSRQDYLQNLPAGATIPAEKRIYTQTAKDAFEEECRALREKAQSITGELLEDLKAKATEAPSTEAVNSITLLRMRNKVQEREINDLLTRYGDNPQAWRAIASIANEHEIYGIGEHPVDQQIANLEGLNASIRGLSSNGAKEGLATAGYSAFIGMRIDEVLSPEE